RKNSIDPAALLSRICLRAASGTLSREEWLRKTIGFSMGTFDNLALLMSIPNMTRYGTLLFLLVCASVANAVGNIQVFFSPSRGCTAAVVANLNQAKSNVFVQAYSFT